MVFFNFFFRKHCTFRNRIKIGALWKKSRKNLCLTYDKNIWSFLTVQQKVCLLCTVKSCWFFSVYLCLRSKTNWQKKGNYGVYMMKRNYLVCSHRSTTRSLRPFGLTGRLFIISLPLVKAFCHVNAITAV